MHTTPWSIQQTINNTSTEFEDRQAERIFGHIRSYLDRSFKLNLSAFLLHGGTTGLQSSCLLDLQKRKVNPTDNNSIRLLHNLRIDKPKTYSATEGHTSTEASS